MQYRFAYLRKNKERINLKKRNLSKNCIVTIWNAARFVSYILAILLTPLLALPLAMLFDPVVSDWWRHGELRVFYKELITAFLWLGEIIAFYLLDKRLQKKFNVQIDAVKEKNTRNAAKDGEQTQTAPQQTSSVQKQAEETAEEAAIAISARTAEADVEKTEQTENTEQARDCNARKAALRLNASSNARTKGKTELLPMRNVIAVFLICAACVLLISAQIGFEVKVFYELGERVILSDVVNFSGTAGKNIAKCGWIVLLIKAAFGIFEGVFEDAPCKPKAKKAYIYLCAALLVLGFGVFDVIVSQNPFWWTYLLFYAAFVAIYTLVRRAPIKSYLLILFIYFF